MDSRFDEWIEFGSERIARLHTKAPPPEPKSSKAAKKNAEKAEKAAKKIAEKAEKAAEKAEKAAQKAAAKKAAKADEKAKKQEVFPCPLNPKNFTVGGKLFEGD